MEARVIKFLLLFSALVISPDCLSVGRDYGIPKSANLISNSSFEDGANYWHANLGGHGKSVLFSVRDWSFPHITKLPNWEGRSTYYRPVLGKKYIELGWAGKTATGAGIGMPAQELPILPPGRYLLIAHVRAHASTAGENETEFPNASVTLTDSSNGSVIGRLTVDWLSARQNWILAAAMVDIKASGSVSIGLGFDMEDGNTHNAISDKTKVAPVYLFDDIRLVAIGSHPDQFIRQFEEKSKLNISSTGIHSRPLYEHEYVRDDLPPRRLSSQKMSLEFASDTGWKCKSSNTCTAFTEHQRMVDTMVLRVTKDQAEYPAEIARDVHFLRGDVANKKYVSVSAWVWSDTPRSAYLRLDYDKEKSAESAFHSGAGKWEFLTVVAPYVIAGDELRLALCLRTGEARFKTPELLVLVDDRFDGILPPSDIGGGRLRERVAFKKDLNRYRIVIVGNSTVNGVAFVAHHASFPYLLQLKLETLYPEKFEVINYGIGAGGLLDQIVSVNHHFKFATNETNYFQQLINPARYETPSTSSLINASRDAVSLAALKPDIIIIASMWNDLDRLFNWHVMDRDYGALGEFLALLDEPSQATYKAYRQKKILLLKEIEKKRADLNPKNYSHAWSTDQSYFDLSHDAKFYAAARKAESKYEELLDAFVARAAKVSNVWNLVLPANGGNKAAEFFDHFPDLMLKADQLENEKKKAIAFYRQVSAEIQSRAGHKVALKYGIQNLDLAGSYNASIEDADAVEWAKLNYFVPDLIHFTYRGNQWIADEIFRLMEVEFESMAKNNN
jgi:hypothetical protein